MQSAGVQSTQISLFRQKKVRKGQENIHFKHNPKYFLISGDLLLVSVAVWNEMLVS